MGKFLTAVLILVLAYFTFLKRTEPPKEVDVAEPEVEQATVTHHSVVSIPTLDVASQVTSVTAFTATDSAVGAEGSLPDEVDTLGTVNKKDEPRENVDQTIVANEKRLTSARSAAEVLELLHKLRIRMKKLEDLSSPATVKDYAKFLGSYEGSVLNRRQESVYNLRLEIKQIWENGKSQITGNYKLQKPTSEQLSGEFKDNFGVTLIGRDALVIYSPDQQNYFQIYKMDNGYLAGSYYEKGKASYKLYRFILKNK